MGYHFVPAAVRCLAVATAALLIQPLPCKSQKGADTLRAQYGSPQSSVLSINNISMWADNDGVTEQRSDIGRGGVTFPFGTANVVYTGGLVWGGFVTDGNSPSLRVGGQTHAPGTVPGRVITHGITEDPFNPDVRVFRVRRDWNSSDLTKDAAVTLNKPVVDVTKEDIRLIREQYVKDWLAWPWQKGAPFYEKNGISGYQPHPEGLRDSLYDEPGCFEADQVIWYVCNDLNATATFNLYGSPPVGLELQTTLWAYDRDDELNNVIFQRFRMIYKGTATIAADSRIDSMYIAKWADIDIGDYSDDLVGSIPARGMGYAYNATNMDREFYNYGRTPPAVGYDIVQGPRVARPGSKATWDGRIVEGFANLPVSSFSFYSPEGGDPDPARGSYVGTRQWWNILRGYQAAVVNPPSCMVDPSSGQCTKFALSGDPRTLQGWVDGRYLPPSDRRVLISSGPFSMALGDTQEVVIALLAAEGETKNEAISALEQVDDRAQDFLTFSFNDPRPVPQPQLRVVELDNEIILDWESDTAYTRALETYASQGYSFESYRVYQYSDTSAASASVSFPPFDPGSARSIRIDTDLLRNKPLVNGQEYYYSVTTTVYNYTPQVHRKRLESTPKIIVAVPHSPNPGVIYPYEVGDTISNAVNTVGINDARVNAIFYDPTKANGHEFKVVFTRPSILVAPKWDLVDMTVGDTLLRDVAMDVSPRRLASYGLSVDVGSPFFGMKRVIQRLSNGETTEDVVFNKPNPGGNYMVVAPGSSQIDSIRGLNPNDRDAEIRFTGDSSWAVMIGPTIPKSYWVRVPYTIWHMDRTSNSTTGRQLYSFITDHGGDSVWRSVVMTDRTFMGKSFRVFYPISALIESLRVDNTYIGGTYHDDIMSQPDEFRTRAFIWINSHGRTTRGTLWKAYIADLDDDGIATPPQTIIRFERYKSVSDGDEKVLKSLAVERGNVDAARDEMSRINVFPNPYYAINRAERNRLDRFVTFNHLPQKAQIRIFTATGLPIRTISKDDASQFARWNLTNENSLPVASGVYIAHITLADAAGNELGTKVLKLMIVQENRFFEGTSR